MTATLPLWRLHLDLAGERVTVYVYADTVDEAFRIPRRFGSPYFAWHPLDLTRMPNLRPPHDDAELTAMAADWCVLREAGC